MSVELFGVPTYLADSMQFALEYGCRLVPEGCFYIMPSFRGEAPDETHLSQFMHSEAELIGDLDHVISVVERYLRALAADIMGELEEELTALVDLAHVADLAGRREMSRLTFSEAVAILDNRPDWVVHGESGWRNLTRAGEKRIMEIVGDFTWVTHWDHGAVPFYQGYADPEGRTALNGDLLFGLGEVVGLGERHRTGTEARRALEDHRVPAADYDWYCRMKDESPLPTSGFGMGIERFLMWVMQHDDIRDMQILPRENGRSIVP